jgi:hypothetical protein
MASMTTKKTSKVLIPMLRQMIPSMLADQIISVQPMTAPASQVYVIKNRWAFKRFEVLHSPDDELLGQYAIVINVPMGELAEILHYCKDTFVDNFTVENNKIWFNSEADRTLFLLRWEE